MATSEIIHAKKSAVIASSLSLMITTSREAGLALVELHIILFIEVDIFLFLF